MLFSIFFNKIFRNIHSHFIDISIHNFIKLKLRYFHQCGHFKSFSYISGSSCVTPIIVLVHSNPTEKNNYRKLIFKKKKIRKSISHDKLWLGN